MKNKLRLQIIILILGSSVFLFGHSAQAALRCVSDTSIDGNPCLSASGYSWCMMSAAEAKDKCAIESKEVCLGTITGGTHTFDCNNNSCLLTCNSTYTKCTASKSCMEKTTGCSTMNCNAADPECTTCSANYALCTLGVTSDALKGTCISNSSNHCATFKGDTTSTANCTSDAAAGHCATCVSGYARCTEAGYTALADKCIQVVGGCPTGQSWDVCDGQCEGPITPLKLSFDSLSSPYLINSPSASPAITVTGLKYVGLGTTNPTTTLDVASARNFSIYAGGKNIGGVGMPQADTDAATKGYVDTGLLSLSNASAFWSGTSTGNIWNINSGNVGIGTTAPGALLDVYGTLNAGNRVNLGLSAPTASFHSGAVGLMIRPSTGDRAIMELHSPTNNSRMVIQAVDGAGVFIQSLTTQPTVFNNNYTGSYLRIDGSSVDRGIKFSSTGVINPVGLGLVGSALQVTDGGTGMGTLIAGNVGIGTTAPGSKFQISVPGLSEYSGTDVNIIQSNITLEGTAANRTVGTGPSITFRFPANTDGLNIWDQARILATPDNGSNGSAIGRLYLQVRDNYNPGTGGSWNWRTGIMIAGNGNVGIGTTAPSTKLHLFDSTSGPIISLSGTSTANYRGLRFTNTSNSEKFFTGLNDSNNYVLRASSSFDILSASSTVTGIGIGTNFPPVANSELAVSGKLKVHGEFGAVVIDSLKSATVGTDEVITINSDGQLNSVAASSGVGKFVGNTANTYTGDNTGTGGGILGYEAAHNICSNTVASSSHVCSSAEMLNSVASGAAAMPTVDAWIFIGPPGYLASVSDCEGRTLGVNTAGGFMKLGAFWQAPGTGYPKGLGQVGSCGASRALACCK